MSKSVLILGGTGFLGQNLTKVLVSDGYQVDSHDSSLNVLNYELLDKHLTKHKYSIVINAAGQVTKPIDQCRLQNTKGVQNIVNLQKKFKFKLVHISSLLALNPESKYAQIKAKAETLITSNLQSNDYLIIRLSNLYGPGQKKGLITYLLTQIKSKKTQLQFNDNNGSLSRYFLHINDASQNINKMLKNQQDGIINLPGPDKYNLKHLLTLINQISDLNINAQFSTKKPHDNINNKLETKNFSFKYNLKDYLIKNLTI